MRKLITNVTKTDFTSVATLASGLILRLSIGIGTVFGVYQGFVHETFATDDDTLGTGISKIVTIPLKSFFTGVLGCMMGTLVGCTFSLWFGVILIITTLFKRAMMYLLISKLNSEDKGHCKLVKELLTDVNENAFTQYELDSLNAFFRKINAI